MCIRDRPWVVRQAIKLYEPVLRWSLANTRVISAIVVATLAVTVIVYLQIGKTFMPVMDEGDILMQIEKLPSINLEKSLELDLAVQRKLMEKVPEVKGVVARVGSDELGLDPMGLNQTDSFLVLKPKNEWRMRDKEALTDETVSYTHLDVYKRQ